MSVPPTHTTVIQMRLVQTLRAVSRVPAILDSLETEHTVRMSMNVLTVPVIPMQHATIWSDLTHVLAKRVLLLHTRQKPSGITFFTKHRD